MLRWPAPPRLLALAFASALGVTAARPAAAEPSLSDRETARSLMDEGDAKRDKGDFAAALKSYEAADAIMRVPTTGLELARTQAQLGLFLEARETLARVLRLPPKPNDPPAFIAARRAADSFNAELGTRIPSITVLVTNAEAGQTAAVAIDGESVPPAAAQAPRKVNPGRHTVVVRSGAIEKREEVTVAEREARILTVDLKRAVVAPSGGGAAQADRRPASAADTSSLPTVLVFGGFALGAVGVGVGTVTGLMAFSQVNDLKKSCVNDVCPGRQDDIDSAMSLGTISTVAFIAGGLGLGAGVIGLVMKSRQSSESRATGRAQPVVGPTWLGVRGVF